MTLDMSPKHGMNYAQIQNQRKLESLAQLRENYGRAQGMLQKKLSVDARSPSSSFPADALVKTNRRSPKSQLTANMVPGPDSLSNFIEAGQVYAIKHAGKDTESHLQADLTPMEGHDLGSGFDGWYGNGESEAAKANWAKANYSSITTSMCPAEEANTWQSGWYSGGAQFETPLHAPRIRGHDPANHITPHHTKSQVTFNNYGESKDQASTPTRRRSVARKKSLAVDVNEPPWSTAYTNFCSPSSQGLSQEPFVKVRSPKDSAKNFCSPPHKQKLSPTAPPWMKES